MGIVRLVAFMVSPLLGAAAGYLVGLVPFGEEGTDAEHSDSC